MERVLAQILFISLQLGYLISENITGEQGGVGEREFRLEYVFLLIIHHSVISLPYLPPPLSLSHTHIHVHTHTYAYTHIHPHTHSADTLKFC